MRWTPICEKLVLMRHRSRGQRLSRRTGLLIIQSLLGLGLLAAWAWAVDLREVGRTLSQARWTLIFLAAALTLCSTVVRAVRWRIVLRSVALVPLVDLWLISVASSLVNFVIPVRSGEVARGLLLKQRHKVSIAASLPTVAVDRSFDLLAVLMLVAAGALIGVHLEGRLSALLLAGGIVLIAFAVFLVMAIWARSHLMKIAGRLMPRFLGASLRERLLGILEGLITGFTTIGRRPQDLASLLGLSIVAALIDASMFYCLFVGTGALLPLPVVVTGYSLFVVTFLVPGAPGYVGSYEAFGSLIFSALGVATDLAASTVLLSHALNVVMVAITGGVAMGALGLRPAQAVRSFVNPPAGNGMLEPTPTDRP
jgi:uncharacterized protein (TIRG00374 family)